MCVHVCVHVCVCVCVCVCLYIHTSCNMMLSSYMLGRTGYTNLTQELKTKVDLPAHYRLMQHKNSVML